MNAIRPLKIYVLCLSALFCCCPLLAQRSANPLLGMIGREPCSAYFEAYQALSDSLFSGDSLARVELMRLFSEAAAADPTGAWELDRRRIEGHVRFFESRKGGYIPSAEYTAEKFAEDLVRLARLSGEKGFEPLRLRSMFDAAAVNRIFAEDYPQAFALYLETADRAANLSLEEFPWKFHLYMEIADFYLSFREYEDAAHFYRLIAEDAEMASDNLRLFPALNGLGQYYRYGQKLEKSDSCFRSIIERAAGEERYVWEGIAAGNIGYNHYLRGDRERALEWMKPALNKVKRPNDDPFASRLATNIAAICLDRSDLNSAKKYIGIALDRHRRSRLPNKDSRLLEVLAQYHVLSGDRRQAVAWLDSTLRAKEREEKTFSGLVLRRVEQQLRAADRKAHEQQLGAEQMRSRTLRQTTILISGALAVILILLALVSTYYRRTHRAYRELVRKSQQWAGVGADGPPDEAPSPSEEVSPPPAAEDIDIGEAAEAEADDHLPNIGIARVQPLSKAFDRTIMSAVEQAVVGLKMYKQADLTLDMLSAATGYNRYYLSAALNRCMGVNFNTYVNEQRIKEAVRLMSDPANAELTVDAIAFDAGFNDRKNFYRVFKKTTGLSPTQFRRNTAA